MTPFLLPFKYTVVTAITGTNEEKVKHFRILKPTLHGLDVCPTISASSKTVFHNKINSTE